MTDLEMSLSGLKQAGQKQPVGVDLMVMGMVFDAC